jgi:probable F420-dependent oxidoreductase
VKVRIGFGLGTMGASADARSFAALVDALEDLRFDSLWLSERATGPTLDPLVALSVAAGRTTRLKLGTSVQVLPGRNPVLLAKEWASLDLLSGGRALPAFGLGVVDPVEQQAFGVTREERASRFDEALALLRRFWTEDTVDHDGTWFHYEGVGIGIRPVQQPPDVWLGGRSPGELRRVGRLADGWLPSFQSPAEVQAGQAIVVDAAAAAGRAIDPEHWGALVAYSPTEIPPPVLEAIGRRLPGVDAAAVVPIGHEALRRTLEGFIAVGFSKLVPVPFGAPIADWEPELSALAAATCDLTT